MKGMGKEDVVALHPLVPRHDVGVEEGRPLTEVEQAIGVGVGRVDEVLGPGLVSPSLVDLCLFPTSLPTLLHDLPVVALARHPRSLRGFFIKPF